MKYKSLFTVKLLAGIITGIYTFDFRRAWAEEIVMPEPAAQVLVIEAAGE